MLAIGLGKQKGAAICHMQGYDRLSETIVQVATAALAATPFVFGVCLLENAHDHVFHIQVLSKSELLDVEPGLLEMARRAMPRIPFSDIDVLVIDRIGKNLSGEGADPNITGRTSTGEDLGGPRVARQVVLDLTEETHGNALGLGTADFTTVRAARKFLMGYTYPNALTAIIPRAAGLPMALPSDKLAIAAALYTCPHSGPPRVVRIPDTLHLDRVMVSEGLLADVRRTLGVELTADFSPPAFDDAGNLVHHPRASGCD
jgi:hypothetical protein